LNAAFFKVSRSHTAKGQFRSPPPNPRKATP